MGHFLSKEMWGGFLDGKLAMARVDDGFGGWGRSWTGYPALYTTKREARERFKDVRKVRIVEVNPKRKRP